MYKQNTMRSTGLFVNKSSEGEPIEYKLDRVVNNKEPIKDGAPIIFTERKDGVIPSYNIRTDRWEIAIDAMDKVAKSYKARREEMNVVKGGKNNPKNDENDGGAEPTQGGASTEVK